MAQAFYNPSVSGISLFEDLANFVKEISFAQTQFLTRCGTTKATALTHSWTTQALRAAASNRRAGGYTPSFAAADVTANVKRNNQVQFMANPYSVEDSLEWIGEPGVGYGEKFNRQTYLKKKELALDMDRGLIRETVVTRDDDAGTAGQMDGVLAWATGARSISAANAPLTEDLYNDLAQVIAEQSGETPTEAFVNGRLKRAITNWTTAIRRLPEGNKTYVNSIGEYDGDWGTQRIIWNFHMADGVLLLCKMEYNKVSYGVPVKTVQLGKSGDTERGYVKTELTFEAQNPNTIGQITSIGA